MQKKRNLTSFRRLRVLVAQELLAPHLARALFLGCTVDAISVSQERQKLSQEECRVSNILTNVRVALATTDVQSILEIPATDQMHMEDRNHGLP